MEKRTNFNDLKQVVLFLDEGNNIAEPYIIFAEDIKNIQIKDIVKNVFVTPNDEIYEIDCAKYFEIEFKFNTNNINEMASKIYAIDLDYKNNTSDRYNICENEERKITVEFSPDLERVLIIMKSVND